jgi:uncharacterized protein YutD
MSIWYQTSVTCLAANKTAVAKFFNLSDSFDDVRTDSFGFSFGGKNGPSLRLSKMMEQNPDLIFLINENIEDTEQWFLMRFDELLKEQQYIRIQDFGAVENKLNKKILEAYEKELPGLPLKHLNGKEGYEGFRWKMFFNDFNKTAVMLRQYADYKEMVNPYAHYGVKMYIVEGEYEGHKDWQGPFPLEKAERVKEKYSKQEGVTNMIVREVEPR